MLKRIIKRSLRILMSWIMITVLLAGGLVLPVNKVLAVGNDDFYGVHCGNDTTVSKAIPVLNDIGARWVRLWTDCTWASIPSTEPGAFQKARDFKNAGFKVIMVFNHHGGADQQIPTYSQSKAYFDWAMGTLGNAVDIYEIGNELNVVGAGKYWPSSSDADLQAYVNNLLKGAWDSLHPSGKKVLGASCTAWQNGAYSTYYTQKLKDFGYLNYCDYAGTHPYTDTVSNMVNHVNAVKNVYGTKPLIATEWNLKSASNTPSYVNNMDSARSQLKDKLYIACYYRLLGMSSEGGWPGVCYVDANGNYQPQVCIYDMYKTWPKNGDTSNDTTAPSVPTNLSGSAAWTDKINLSWSSSSDNVGVLGYRIYRNGTWVGSTHNTSYTDTGLSANTSYSYTVAAYDGKGNLSAQSSAKSATTFNGYTGTASADAYVAENYPTTNYGTVGTNLIKGVSGYNKYIYLKFDAGSLSANDCSSASIFLYNLNSLSSAVPLTIYSVTDDSWAETGITWTNKVPSVTALKTINVQASGSYEFDVTSYVKSQLQAGDKTISFCVKDDALKNIQVNIGSNNNSTTSYKPKLNIVCAASALSPVADAYVNEQSSGTNYGTSTTLQIRGSSGFQKVTYLKFDLTNVSGASSAKLRLYGKYDSGVTKTVYCKGVSSTSWTEAGITWNNKPTIGSTISSINVSGTSQYFEWDVTSYVQSNYGKTITLAIVSSSTNYSATFNSKENSANKPELVIQ